MPRKTSVAGRIFGFSERTEVSLVERMRDLDEMIAQMRLLYPENTWKRADFLLMFFLDDIGDAVLRIDARGEDDE